MTSWRRPEDMSWENLKDVLDKKKKKKKKKGISYLTYVNVYVSKKSIFHKSISDESKVNPKLLIRTK